MDSQPGPYDYQRLLDQALSRWARGQGTRNSHLAYLLHRVDEVDKRGPAWYIPVACSEDLGDARYLLAVRHQARMARKARKHGSFYSAGIDESYVQFDDLQTLVERGRIECLFKGTLLRGDKFKQHCIHFADGRLVAVYSSTPGPVQPETFPEELAELVFRHLSDSPLDARIVEGPPTASVTDRAKSIIDSLMAELADASHLPPYYPVTGFAVSAITAANVASPYWRFNPLGFQRWFSDRTEADHLFPWIAALSQVSNEDLRHLRSGEFKKENIYQLYKDRVDFGYYDKAMAEKTIDLVCLVAEWKHWLFIARNNCLDDCASATANSNQRRIVRPSQTAAAALAKLFTYEPLENCPYTTLWCVSRGDASKSHMVGVRNSPKCTVPLPEIRQNYTAGKEDGIPRIEVAYILIDDHSPPDDVHHAVDHAWQKLTNLDAVENLTHVIQAAFDAFALRSPPDFPDGVEEHFPKGKATQLLTQNDVRQDLLRRASDELANVLRPLGHDEIAMPSDPSSSELSTDEWMLLQTAKCFSKCEIPLALLSRLISISNISPEFTFGVSTSGLPREEISRRSSMFLYGLKTLLLDSETKPWQLVDATIHHCLTTRQVNGICRSQRDMEACRRERLQEAGAGPGGRPCKNGNPVIQTEPCCHIVLASALDGQGQVANLASLIKRVEDVLQSGDDGGLSTARQGTSAANAIARVHQSGLVRSIVPGYDFTNGKVVLDLWIGLSQHNSR